MLALMKGKVLVMKKHDTIKNMECRNLGKNFTGPVDLSSFVFRDKDASFLGVWGGTLSQKGPMTFFWRKWRKKVRVASVFSMPRCLLWGSVS